MTDASESKLWVEFYGKCKKCGGIVVCMPGEVWDYKYLCLQCLSNDDVGDMDELDWIEDYKMRLQLNETTDHIPDQTTIYIFEKEGKDDKKSIASKK